MKTENFNFDRFKILLNRQLTLNLKTWLIAIGSLGGLLLFISYFMMISGNHENIMGMYSTFGVFAFFVTGLVFTSLSFSEMGTYTKSLQFITLPASRFEKFFTAWFSSSILYIILSIISLVVFSIISSLIDVAFFHSSFAVFNPFVKGFGEVILGYFIAHSLYFIGSVWFTKGAFFKTLLAGFIAQTVANFWMLIWGVIIFKPSVIERINNNEFNEFVLKMDNSVRAETIVISFFCLIACILLYASWERFKEREV
ncbi:MAG TPA: hypothetical protein PKG88_08485 [Bacteroidales bacterium]|jgi:hypothetical protein|nr:hypothetical protein [Bacteroidales bacterium]HPS72589.1 hypothetical protein [Bacteroidales bacterium]